MAVGTGLKIKGHNVTIHDGPMDEVPVGYDAYGFGPTIAEYSHALEIKDSIRAHTPEAKIVLGGPFATLRPHSCMDDGWDCVLLGDGEIKADEAFRGDTWSKTLRGEECPLDEYPMIDRTLLDIKSYEYTIEGRLSTTMVTSRGCPYRCGFCSKNHGGTRLLSAGKIIEEIDYLHKDFGYEALMFSEDIFIINKRRAIPVFEHMKKRGIVSRVLLRADVAVKHGADFLKLMAESGCVEVGMGVESGSDTILKNINKGESIDTIKAAVRALKNASIRVKGFFIVGLPGETKDTLNETRRFLDEMQLDDVDIKIFQPYPGSPIWNHKDQYDIQWHDSMDYRDMFYKGRPREYYGNVRTSALTTREIYEEWVDMEAQYKRG
jgi:radical SAM superfamily enzyme YgiQ (UPF0313 family)